MKQAFLLPVSFVFLSVSAQQTGNGFAYELPAYHHIKIEEQKKYQFPLQPQDAGARVQMNSYLLARPAVPAYSFTPLKNYLSEDLTYFRLQQKTKEWTEFNSGLLHSYYKQQWLENKNNYQQRWMAQKIKGN